MESSTNRRPEISTSLAFLLLLRALRGKLLVDELPFDFEKLATMDELDLTPDHNPETIDALARSFVARMKPGLLRLIAERHRTDRAADEALRRRVKNAEPLKPGQRVRTLLPIFYYGVNGAEIGAGAIGLVVEVRGGGFLPFVQWEGRSDFLATSSFDSLEVVTELECDACDGGGRARTFVEAGTIDITTTGHTDVRCPACKGPMVVIAAKVLR